MQHMLVAHTPDTEMEIYCGSYLLLTVGVKKFV